MLFKLTTAVPRLSKAPFNYPADVMVSRAGKKKLTKIWQKDNKPPVKEF